MYRKGEGVDKDYDKALELCEKSEYSSGIDMLAYYYSKGIGTEVIKRYLNYIKISKFRK